MKEKFQQQDIRVIKDKGCESLSGKSLLKYQIGCHGDEIFFRVATNSGGGFFSGKWILLKRLLGALESTSQPLTSYALQTLFNGKSVNTAAFLFAALKEEGLVAVDPTNPRCYVLQPVDQFMQTTKALIKSLTTLKAESDKSKSQANKL